MKEHVSSNPMERRTAVLPVLTTLLWISLVVIGISAEPSPTKSGADSAKVRIVVGFEGSCPHSPEGVKQEGPGRFRILPSWRASPGVSEEAVGRSTRLGFKVVNASRTEEAVELRIDWQYHDAPPKDCPKFASVEEFMSYRDFAVVKWPGRSDWQTVMADVDDTVARLVLHVPPGETEVHWHPPYTYTQSEQFVASLGRHPLVEVEKIGQSREGRNLWMLKITDRSPRAKKAVLIRARVHAYESAGSYAMEGMVRWLLSGEPYAAAAVHQYVFHVMPMANPDGVFNGLGRLTAPQGADLVMMPPTADPAHTAISQALQKVQPSVYIDLHNWQNKRTDGLLGIDPEIRQHFVRFMPDQAEFGKQWMITEPRLVASSPPARELLGDYCRREFKSVTVAFEFPWFGRSPDDMRAAGRKTLWALSRALDEFRDTPNSKR